MSKLYLILSLLLFSISLSCKKHEKEIQPSTSSQISTTPDTSKFWQKVDKVADVHQVKIFNNKLYLTGYYYLYNVDTSGNLSNKWYIHSNHMLYDGYYMEAFYNTNILDNAIGFNTLNNPSYPYKIKNTQFQFQDSFYVHSIYFSINMDSITKPAILAQNFSSPDYYNYYKKDSAFYSFLNFNLALDNTSKYFTSLNNTSPIILKEINDMSIMGNVYGFKNNYLILSYGNGSTRLVKPDGSYHVIMDKSIVPQFNQNDTLYARIDSDLYFSTDLENWKLYKAGSFANVCMVQNHLINFSNSIQDFDTKTNSSKSISIDGLPITSKFDLLFQYGEYVYIGGSAGLYKKKLKYFFD